MDSVIMTTPSNSMRLRSRFRSAANTICARSSKNRSNSNKNHNSSAKNVRGFYKSHGAREGKNCSVNKHVNIINNRNILILDDSNNRCVATSNNNGNDIKDNKLLSFCRGKCAREVYNAWCGRLGDVTRIPSDSVQALFNDMQLYPSKSQVLEMLACARTCGRRNTSHFLTFGEFCVFAGELRRGGRGRPHHNQVQRTSKPISHCEVFLGGSCNPTTWRADVAIPALSKLGISYYNPQVSTWGPELMAAEHNAKESASVLLFVVDSQTRCVAGMLEVAHLVAKQRCLVLVVYPFSRGQSIMDEPLSAQEFMDLTEGQSTLLTLVRNQGITVHSNLSTALQCTVGILRGTENTTDTIVAERRLTEKLMTLRETFDALDPDRTGELTLSNVSLAYFQLTGTNLRISDLHSIMNLSDHSNPDDVRINFEQFCGVMAEFTTSDGCNTTRLDGANRFTNPIYWKLAMLRTQQLLRIYVVRPIVNIIDWVNQPLQRQTSTNNNSNFEYTSLNNQKHNQQNGEHYVVNGDNTYQRYDIYLGGSCMKKTTWRQNIAIPLLKKYGVTYYNPSLHENNCTQAENFNILYLNGDRYDPDMNDNSSVECAKNSARDLLHDMEVMNKSKVVLFVITNETRSITSMILAAHYIALRKNVVLCVQQLPLENCIIGSDVLTKQAIKDYNRARAYLSDLAKHENVPIFQTVKEAVQCAVNLAQTPQR